MERVSRIGNALWQHQRPLQSLSNQGVKIALILLNRPFEKNLSLIKQLWSVSIIKHCVDGGLNHLNKLFGQEADLFIPDIISGDFDSANKDLLTHYKNKGSSVVETHDQDETDFTKGLRLLVEKLPEKKEVENYNCIVCIGAFGGRIDHIMGNLNSLYTAAQLQKKPCYLLSSTSMACLLKAGSHVLNLDTGFEGDWCGLIPLGSSVSKIYTSGLKWNLDGQEMAFGSLISTSNEIVSNEVIVETTQPILWTMGVKYF